ncbi:Fanconi anemia group B protein isoform X2 [Synchiropus splendidus]|uniref:Fanconi anemia group B protein isoform X2 n=1 Tax=Synchiropus splendidus TaxID=270530 RepID=UPI00237DA0BB|nr:Fanconi anemia group B protein isoform X2 [Synchiropus splendidus]
MDATASQLLQPHFVAIDGRVARVTCRRAARKHQVSCRTFWFDADSRAFVESPAAEGVREAAGGEVLRCQRAFDEASRCSSACVLLESKRKKGDGFRYCLLLANTSNHLRASLGFTLPYQIDRNVRVLQGPTVVWARDGRVFHVQAGEVCQAPAPLSNITVGLLPVQRGQIFILGQQDQPDDFPTAPLVGSFLKDGQTFDGTQILPQPYLSLTTCLLVLSADRGDGGVLRSTAVVATSNQQLVYLESGVVQDTCRLPFEQPEGLAEVHTGRNGLLIVVSFHHGNVCALWKETFQVAAQWSGVASVHVDDFLRCGTEQLLLLFKDGSSEGSSLDSFLITDLCGLSFSGPDQEEGKPPLPTAENYCLTLRALESRLQSGVTRLEELQRDVRVKERVLQQSVRALVDAAAQREPTLTPHQQEGLVPLWDSDDESMDESSLEVTEDVPGEAAKPRVDKLWHRVHQDRLVVGVILSADTPLAAVTLSVVTATEASFAPAVIHTQVFRLPPDAPPPPAPACQPPAKRSKRQASDAVEDLRSDRVAVTAVTSVAPLLTSDSVKCRVMLHYVQGPKAAALPNNPTPVVLPCGLILLDVRQSSTMRLPDDRTDGALEDLLSLLSVLDHWIFRVDSPGHSLGDVDGWMEKRLACRRSEVNPEYLIKSSEAPAAVLLQWQQPTPFTGELTVHGSHLQMLQFLHSFLPFLPDACSVRLLNRSRVQQSAAKLPAALQDELLTVLEFLSLLQPQQQGDKPPADQGDPDPGSEEGLRRCREAWQQEALRSRACLSPLLDVERYHTLTQRLTVAQLETDLAALVATQD